MSTVFVNFQPSASQAFQFQPTLDGTVYTCIVKWNIYGQRWYLNIYTLNGVRVLTRPMVGSPLGTDISITALYFNTKIVYRIDNQQIEVIS